MKFLAKCGADAGTLSVVAQTMAEVRGARWLELAQILAARTYTGQRGRGAWEVTAVHAHLARALEEAAGDSEQKGLKAADLVDFIASPNAPVRAAALRLAEVVNKRSNERKRKI